MCLACLAFSRNPQEGRGTTCLHHSLLDPVVFVQNTFGNLAEDRSSLARWAGRKKGSFLLTMMQQQQHTLIACPCVPGTWSVMSMSLSVRIHGATPQMAFCVPSHPGKCPFHCGHVTFPFKCWDDVFESRGRENQSEPGPSQLGPLGWQGRTVTGGRE